MGPGPADVAQGVVLDGRYRIDAVIGQGGMATVYRARDTRLDRDVAVKLFPPTPDSDEILRHEAEISVLAHMDHPGLVALHDAGSAYAGGAVRQTYIVMELVPGPTLGDLLATGPLTLPHTGRIGRQLAEAIATVHAAGVVHRDIKPANILLVERGAAVREDPGAALTTGPIVKLADFGIARFADGARLTMTGTTLGTATYLSPEQATGTDVGPSTDVYALALVLLECLTGEKAFVGTVAEVAAARLTRDPTIPEWIGAAWRSLIADMTRRDADERITMAEAAHRLVPLAVGAPHTTLSPVLTAPVPKLPRPQADAPEGVAAGTPGGLRGDAHSEPTQPVPMVAANRGRTAAHTPPSVEPAVVRARPAWGSRGWSTRLRLAIVAAVAVVLVSAVAMGVVGGQDETGPTGPTREYPMVDGELGEAIDELARSVEP